jgi:two-component sensor histidine kinase
MDPVWNFVCEDMSPLKVEDYPVSRVLSTKQPLTNFVLGVIRPDRGHVTWVTVNAIPLFNADDSLEKVIINFVDITRSKQAEMAIRLQLMEKEMLLKEVHHRIKNNIASIGNMLKLQVDALADGESHGVLQDAISRVESMRVMYDKLLLAGDYREISVKQYLEDLMPAIANIFPEKNKVTIKTEIDDFPLTVKKLFPLGAIVNELVTNSMKYAFADRKSGIIDIALSKKENEITLVVQDNGIGLPDTIDVNESTCFGLMLVKMLSQQLKGTFSFEGENGVRCVVIFEA